MPVASGVPLLDNSVTTAKLKTSYQTQNQSLGTAKHTFTLTGGEYCFKPTTHKSGSGTVEQFGGAVGYSYATIQGMENFGATQTVYCQHRYITSSGEIVWLFILRDRISKEVLGMSIAPDHPCMGAVNPDIILHPFTSYVPAQHEIICVNPSLEQYYEIDQRSIIIGENDRNMLDVIIEDYELVESDDLNYPDIPVTVGLPKRIMINGRSEIVDYRFLPPGSNIIPIKKVIEKPGFITVKRLRLI